MFTDPLDELTWDNEQMKYRIGRKEANQWFYDAKGEKCPCREDQIRKADLARACICLVPHKAGPEKQSSQALRELLGSFYVVHLDQGGSSLSRCPGSCFSWFICAQHY